MINYKLYYIISIPVYSFPIFVSILNTYIHITKTKCFIFNWWIWFGAYMSTGLILVFLLRLVSVF